jgi:glycosyltransferase involved in cell wall biosynthesis
MKILHLLDIPWWSGLSSYAFDCIQAHSESGHSVLLVCEKDGLPHQQAEALGIETISIGSRKSRHALANWIRTGAAISSFSPDWIVAHTGSTHWIAWSWGKMKGIPVVRTRATAQSAKSGPINRGLYAATQRIVVGSEKLARECRAQFGLDDTVQVAEPPVEAAQRPASTGSAQKFGMLARLDPIKGHSVFLKAAKILKDSHPGSEFSLAGPEENIRWPDLLRECRDLRLEGISYEGFLERSKIWNFMSGCTAGVIASLGSEEISRALLEWMAMGKPVIATRVGCIPEVMEDGKNGFIVPPGDPAALADRMKFLLENPAQAAQMGENNRKLCTERFSRKTFRSAWEKILASPKAVKI